MSLKSRPNRQSEPVEREERRPFVLDSTNRAIVEQLQEDGRRTYGAVGAAVGLSEAATRARIRQLLDAEVMQIVAVTDPLRIGFKRQALIGITADGDLDAIAEQLVGVREIVYVVVCAGSFDLLLEVVCEDDEHLLGLLNGKVRSIRAVRTVEVFVYLRLAKQTYSWGTG